jgi:hypothetical protein
MKARIALGVLLLTAVSAAAGFGQERAPRKVAYTSAYTNSNGVAGRFRVPTDQTAP